MAATKLMSILLCLSALICGSFSQGRYYGYGNPGQNPGIALRAQCHTYERELYREGQGFCDHDIIEEVYKRARNRGIRQLFRGVFRGDLCYFEGDIVATVRNPCHAMDLSCGPRASTSIDYCATLRAAAARPPVTTRPNIPGRGI